MRNLISVFFLLMLCAQSHASNEDEKRSLSNPALTGNLSAGIDKTWQSVIDAGVKVRTFTQEHQGETVTRRYLTYLPKSFTKEKSYPLIIVLHGAFINAEITRQFDTNNDLESLADREGFIVVYGNALNHKQTQPKDDPFFANTGTWIFSESSFKSQRFDNDLEQLDLAYLVKIESDLEKLGVKINPDARFISGISNGGQTTLIAADKLAPRYRAAYAGVPLPVAPSRKTHDISMMFYYSENDPAFTQFFPNYSNDMNAVIKGWGKSIGIDESAFTHLKFKAYKNTVNEGTNYAGENPKVLTSMNSAVEYGRVTQPTSNNQILILKSKTAGHGIPHPLQFTPDAVEQNGLRNEDVNSIHIMWAFFKQFIDG